MLAADAPPEIDAAFARAMAAYAPFETAPALGIALSGGADSTALALLARRWAGERGGSVTALIVDHGLRGNSAEEAQHVAGWAARWGMWPIVLTWNGPRPTTGIQAAAREARYRLLTGFCRDAGLLHLLIGHHRQDQIETVMHRLVRGSQTYGLAGIAPLVRADGVRILRPLLGCEPEDLRVWLRTAGCSWLEDPSNADPRYARGTLRRLLPSLDAAGLTAGAVLEATSQAGMARRALEDAVGDLLAAACRLHPAGFAVLSLRALMAGSPPVVEHALRRCLGVVGGGRYLPAAARITRLREWLAGGSSPTAMTLGRCRVSVEGEAVLICRERRNLPPPQAVGSPCRLEWDGRFRILLSSPAADGYPLVLRPATDEDWRAASEGRNDGAAEIPVHVRPTLPAVIENHGRVTIPGMSYAARGSDERFIQVLWPARAEMPRGGYFLV